MRGSARRQLGYHAATGDTARKLSRVSSYDALGNYALTPVGTAIAGPLASAFGSRAVLAAGGALVVILPVLVLLVSEVRNMRRK